jgi:RNA recognition motif-containing protein
VAPPRLTTIALGNLPTEKVSKRDVFRRFSRYGKLAQISLKQAYGFVQFLSVDACSRAKEAEQDMPIKGRKMR